MNKFDNSLRERVEKVSLLGSMEQKSIKERTFEKISKRLKFLHNIGIDIDYTKNSLTFKRSQDDTEYNFTITFANNGYILALQNSTVLGTSGKNYFLTHSGSLPSIDSKENKTLDWRIIADLAASYIKMPYEQLQMIVVKYVQNKLDKPVNVVVSVTTIDGRKIKGLVAKNKIVSLMKQTGAIIQEASANVPKIPQRLRVKNQKQSLDNARDNKTTALNWGKDIKRLY
jgi:hypothetical protein